MGGREDLKGSKKYYVIDCVFSGVLQVINLHISYLEYVHVPSCTFLLCSLRCPIIVASKLQCLHWYLTPSCTDFLRSDFQVAL